MYNLNSIKFELNCIKPHPCYRAATNASEDKYARICGNIFNFYPRCYSTNSNEGYLVMFGHTYLYQTFVHYHSFTELTIQ